MPKRSSKSKSQVAAQQLSSDATGRIVSDGDTVKEPEKNPAAVALGRLGGLKGGKARAAKLTPEQRAAIAKKAAETRWAQIDEKPPSAQK